jgi:hypothetical protein
MTAFMKVGEIPDQASSFKTIDGRDDIPGEDPKNNSASQFLLYICRRDWFPDMIVGMKREAGVSPALSP